MNRLLNHDPTESGRLPRSRGFTLIEILVVTAVIGLLISVLLPSLMQAREEARRTVCMANLKQVGAAVFSYAAVNKENGPMVMLPLGDRAPRELLSTPGRLVNLGLTWPTNTADPAVFLCPSQQQFSYTPDTRRLRADTVAGSYAYAAHIPAGQSPRLGALRHLAMAADDFLAGPEGVGVGRYAHRVGYNVLYSDGSVSWYPNPTQSIWRRRIQWPSEAYQMDYQKYLARETSSTPAKYGSGGEDRAMDVFEVWKSFCYRRPDPFQ